MSNYTGKTNDISYYIRAIFRFIKRMFVILFKELLPLVVYQERNIIFLELLYPLLTPRNTEGC